MSLFVIVFLCHKVTGMRFVLKYDKLLGNGTFVCGYVCVSMCLFVCVWYKFCAKLMSGWSCLSVANHRTGPTSASSSANYNWCNMPAASSTRSSNITDVNYHTIDDVTYQELYIKYNVL